MSEYNASFFNRYEQAYGKLSVETSHISKGKKLFTWSYHFDDCGNHTSYEIPIYLRSSNKDELLFAATSDLFTWKTKELINSDIELLRKEVSEFFETQMELRADSTRQNWLELTVEGQKQPFTENKYQAMGADVK
jgi:hypothetical protein